MEQLEESPLALAMDMKSRTHSGSAPGAATFTGAAWMLSVRPSRSNSVRQAASPSWLAVTLTVSAPATLSDGMMTGYVGAVSPSPLSCSARSVAGAPVAASAKATLHAAEASSNDAAPTSAAGPEAPLKEKK